MFDCFHLRNPNTITQVSKTPVKLIPDSFIGLIVGPPGTGKSRVIADLLHNTKGLYKKFDLVLFLVPYVEAFDLDIPEDRVNNSLSLEWVKDRINQESDIRDISNCLLIIDDLVSSIAKDHMNPSLIDLFFNRRKLITGVEISIISTTQKYTLFPAKFRSSIQWLIAFNIPNEDMKLITKYHMYQPPPHLNTVISGHFRKPYNFLFIKLDKFGVFLNFDKQI